MGSFPKRYNDPDPAQLNFHTVKLCYLWLLCLCNFAVGGLAIECCREGKLKKSH